MNRILSTTLFVMLLLGLSACSSLGGQKQVDSERPITVDEKFQKIKLITQKLHEMHMSKADFDALEKDGMPKYEVNRLRRVMDKKVKQLTDSTIDLIDAL